MSEPNGYLIHGTAFSSKEAAFKALVSNHDQESWFHKIWDKDAQPYYFEPQPQLTIPKIIADEVVAEGIDAYVIQTSLPSDSYLIPEWEPLVDLSDKLIKWCETTEKWWSVLDAYLAGKALGVDLVKVTED